MSNPTEKGSVLLVEDEENIADLVQVYLEREGYKVTKTATGEDAIEAYAAVRPRVVLLDVGLPGIDGIEVCKRIREHGSVPVIMLTARDSEIDKVLGLEIGADDYVTKPFSPRELLARIKAVLRRSETVPTIEVREIAGRSIDRGRREVRHDEEVIALTPKEFDLLWYLTENKGLVLTRDQIMDAVWGYEYYGETRTVDAHIRQLRKKLGDDFPIRTKWGIGYQLEP
ncbi:MAG: DNA-binding response regulator [Acidobacteria bacterium]|nr:MAG: DNA-binding response regulator [Acidobacteriota bacterium]